MEYIKKCKQCGKDRKFKNRQSFEVSKSDICGSCSAKNKNFCGANNPFYGKKHREDTKKKMSENHADFTGDKNPFKKSLKDPEKLQLHKKRCKDRWDTKDENYRKNFGSKLSIVQAKLHARHSNKNHKSGFFTCSNGDIFYYRSSWEEITLKYLDQLKTIGYIQNFYLEPFCISYQHEGFPYSLRIDFLVELNNEEKIILECKPIGLRSYGRNPIKIQAYKDYCLKNNIKFVLFGIEELQSLEIFKNVII
jgi:NUMOD3 motif